MPFFDAAAAVAGKSSKASSDQAQAPARPTRRCPPSAWRRFTVQLTSACDPEHNLRCPYLLQLLSPTHHARSSLRSLALGALHTVPSDRLRRVRCTRSTSAAPDCFAGSCSCSQASIGRRAGTDEHLQQRRCPALPCDDSHPQSAVISDTCSH